MRAGAMWAVLVAASACGSSTAPNDVQGDQGIGADGAPGDTVADDSSVAPDVVAGDDVLVPTDAPPAMRGHMSFVPPTLRPADARRLIVVGDSISTGTGASMRSRAYYSVLNNNDDARWPMEMATDLTSHFAHAMEFVTVARGGATTTTARSMQLPALRTALPPPAMGHSIVVMTLGGNDVQSALLTGNPTGPVLDSAIGNLRAIVQYLQDRANFPDGVSIYAMDVYDPSDGEGFIRGCFFNLMLPEFVLALEVWRTRYIALATEMGFAVIDGLGHFHGHGFHYDNRMNPYYNAADPTPWFNDCIHPNDRGHHEIRRLFYEAIDPTYRVN